MAIVRLLDAAPDIEIENGLVYILLDGQRTFAAPPHIARIITVRVKVLLDQFDAENANKIVKFK